MRTLNALEATWVSGGGHCKKMNENVQPFVFYSTGVGMLCSFIYALITAEPIEYTIKNQTYSTLSVGSNFLSGVGLFAMSGMLMGGLNHLYQSFQEAPQKKE